MVRTASITSRIMVAESEQKPTKRIRCRYIALTGILFFLICLLIPQAIGRYFYQQAQNELTRNNFLQAQSYIKKARNWLGISGFQNDRKRLDIAEGDLSIRRAESAKTINEFLEQMMKGEKLFHAATTHHSLDIDGYTGLARATAALEAIYPFVYGTPFPSTAQPVYEHLLQLMPVNLYTHKLLIKYYNSRKMEDELQHIVSESIYLHPPLYFQLKRQPFYTLAMNEKVKKSLLKAIANEVKKVDAYKALSDVALLEENYSGAVAYFLQARPDFSYRDNSGYYFRLGKLRLQAELFLDAEQAFLAALKTKERDKRLQDIWRNYEQDGRYSEFLHFAKGVVKEGFASELIEILQAKCLMAMGQYELALSHLIRIHSAQFELESLQLQARIAEYHQDWDTMELRSQRATVLDPENPTSYLLFSRALQNQKKWSQAEQVATHAITRSAEGNPWLYNNRAWIRWNRKDFEGAEQDWQKAIEISPATAGFYYNMALIYERGGNIDQAVIQIEKALSLKPDEQSYLNKLGELSINQQH